MPCDCRGESRRVKAGVCGITLVCALYAWCVISHDVFQCRPAARRGWRLVSASSMLVESLYYGTFRVLARAISRKSAIGAGGARFLRALGFSLCSSGRFLSSLVSHARALSAYSFEAQVLALPPKENGHRFC